MSAEPGVDYAPLHYKRIEHDKIQQLKTHAGNFEAEMPISETAKEDLQWWIDNAALTKRALIRGQPQIQLYSDSSNTAWGGVRDHQSTGGPWEGSECNWHINVKELMAAFLTLRAFCGADKDKHVRLNLDNTTSVAYINNQGGKKPQLNDVARSIWIC